MVIREKLLCFLAVFMFAGLWVHTASINHELRENIRLHKKLRVLEAKRCETTYELNVRATQLVQAVFYRLGLDPNEVFLAAEPAGVGGSDGE